MEACDVLIVGGGPAGSACAWRLVRAGLDVLATDGATFPRHKVCAGWITPPVLSHLKIDAEEYRKGRTFQPITGFRTGLIGRSAAVDTDYGRPVSFGIRRCEFDEYLLRRSGARLRLGAPTRSIRRDARGWIVDEAVRASVIVGAGGHFCPVARWLNPRTESAGLVAAQEVEFAVDACDDASRFATVPERPELYFCPDLQGYGWCFRKEDHLNVGFGRLGGSSLPARSAEFVAYLKATGRISLAASWRWKGHAYLVADPPSRRVFDEALLLVGDAAGLAYPQSGEGILPAIESGLLAAETLLEADGRYTKPRLARYEKRLRKRFGTLALTRALSKVIPEGLAPAVGARLMNVPWFARHWLLDRGFLHAH